MERLALLIILVLAPHTKVPAVPVVYPFRPTDIVLILSALAFLKIGARSRQWSVAGPEMMLAFVIAVASVFWGEYSLNQVNLGTVVEGGARVPYLPIAIKKLMLIVICFMGFQFLVTSRSMSSGQMLKYWYRGLQIAVGLHALCYVVTANFLAVRAGVFVEGNHGGSYYLLSFFLMWFAHQNGHRFGRAGMLASFFGVVLAQSTTGLLLLMVLSVMVYLLMPSESRRVSLGGPAVLLTLLAFGALAAYFGGEVMTKLTGEDVDPSSFSRYDRLASIASGIDMFLEHPVFGVGIQGYAFALPQFVDPFIDSFFDWNSRRIANNIYVELLAEQGLVGMAAMSLVMYRIAKPVLRRFRQQVVLSAGILSVLLSWLAFPTYTISFHWIGLALIVRLAREGAHAAIPAARIAAVARPLEAQ